MAKKRRPKKPDATQHPGKKMPVAAIGGDCDCDSSDCDSSDCDFSTCDCTNHCEHPWHDPIRRIIHALAIEQEQLARILCSLAVKVEKSAGWLPDRLPHLSVTCAVDQAIRLQSVIAQEIHALAEKEESIHKLLSISTHICLPFYHGHRDDRK